MRLCAPSSPTGLHQANQRPHLHDDNASLQERKITGALGRLHSTARDAPAVQLRYCPPSCPQVVGSYSGAALPALEVDGSRCGYFISSRTISQLLSEQRLL